VVALTVRGAPGLYLVGAPPGVLSAAELDRHTGPEFMLKTTLLLQWLIADQPRSRSDRLRARG